MKNGLMNIENILNIKYNFLSDKLYFVNFFGETYNDKQVMRCGRSGDYVMYEYIPDRTNVNIRSKLDLITNPGLIVYETETSKFYIRHDQLDNGDNVVSIIVFPDKTEQQTYNIIYTESAIEHYCCY